MFILKKGHKESDVLKLSPLKMPRKTQEKSKEEFLKSLEESSEIRKWKKPREWRRWFNLFYLWIAEVTIYWQWPFSRLHFQVCWLNMTILNDGGSAAVQIKSVTFLVAQKILITFLKKRVILMPDILRQIRVNPMFFLNNISQLLSKLCWMK